MRIAVDAMGAERGIGIVVEGAIRAIKEEPGIEIILVGDKDKIEEEIKFSQFKEVPFSMVHAPQIVKMTDSATVSLKEKKNSSIAVALNLLRQKKAEALVSAGNTGAVMTASLFKLGKLKGVKRPCLAAVFPTLNGKKVVLLDVGANVDCRPYHLFQFAIMGSIYAYKILRIRNPRVGLLSIGEEENKGNELVLQTFKLMKESSLNFVGNIEGRDITSGKVEVVVCDGFMGNIILKFAEGFAKTVLSIVNELARSNLAGLGRILSRGWLTQINKNLDYAEYGGVPLLGVNGICIIAHGASSSKAIKNAVLESCQFAREKINHYIERVLARNREVENENEENEDSRNRILHSR
jgi:glycerol-3-phosphate acyltransferase PlsX